MVDSSSTSSIIGIMQAEYWSWIAILMLATSIGEISTLKNVQIQVPKAVAGGSTTTLRCLYDLEDSPLYSVKWYRGSREFYRYIPKEIPPTKVLHLPGIQVDLQRSDDHEVVLRNIDSSLSGQFKCEVTADAPVFSTSTVSDYMIVADLPELGPMIRVERRRYEPGDILRSRCISGAARPAANLTWIVNEKKISASSLKDGVISLKSYVESDKDSEATVRRPPKGQRSEQTDVESVDNPTSTPSPVQPPPTAAVSREPKSSSAAKRKTVLQLEMLLTPNHFVRRRIVLTCVSTIYDILTQSSEITLYEAGPVPEPILSERRASGAPDFRPQVSFLCAVLLVSCSAFYQRWSFLL